MPSDEQPTAKHTSVTDRSPRGGDPGIFGSVGEIAGMQLVGQLSLGVGFGRSLALASVVVLGGALLLFALPETMEAPLPDEVLTGTNGY